MVSYSKAPNMGLCHEPHWGPSEQAMLAQEISNWYLTASIGNF